MAGRYCRNCGHELADDDRFCPNCATPVHKAAHVPTPEADRPVPRVPPAAERTAWQRFMHGNVDAPQPAGAPPRRRSAANRLFVGCASVVVVLFLFVGCLAVLGSGGGSGGSSNGGDRDGGRPASSDDKAKGTDNTANPARGLFTPSERTPGTRTP